jgi:SAM-dependent methyltransferase
LNSLTNVDAYKDARWMELHRDLATYSYDGHVFSSEGPPDVYRKGWEWTQTIWGLERLDMIKPHHRAIGVGAGRECVIFWLGDRLRAVVASDLYGGAQWSDTGGREADPAVLEDPQKFCPRPIRNDVIEFKTMDGTDLGFYAADSFDFAWSLSSIEHFGSHERASDAVRELARVVRPGGIVAVATEYLLLPEQSHPEYFNRHDLEEHVIKASPDLELTEPIDWSFPPTDFLIDSVVFPQGAERTRRHVVLNDGWVQWTSVLFFLRKVSR